MLDYVQQAAVIRLKSFMAHRTREKVDRMKKIEKKIATEGPLCRSCCSSRGALTKSKKFLCSGSMMILSAHVLI